MDRRPDANRGLTRATDTIAGDGRASLTTVRWNIPSKAWTGGAVMADASLNRRMTVRVAEAVASAQIDIVGFDGAIEFEALRLFGLPEAAPAVLYACPVQHRPTQIGMEVPSCCALPTLPKRATWMR